MYICRIPQTTWQFRSIKCDYVYHVRLMHLLIIVWPTCCAWILWYGERYCPHLQRWRRKWLIRVSKITSQTWFFMCSRRSREKKKKTGMSNLGSSLGSASYGRVKIHGNKKSSWSRMKLYSAPGIIPISEKKKQEDKRSIAAWRWLNGTGSGMSHWHPGPSYQGVCHRSDVSNR